MTAIERLNAILKQLKQLEDETEDKHNSTFARLQSIASFVEDLPDITQQLETAIIEWEDFTSEQLYIKEGDGEYSAI